jgi:hypothetical protein
VSAPDTRVISFKLFYYYTFLVIRLALLGIGCGGVIVAISRRLLISSKRSAKLTSRISRE